MSELAAGRATNGCVSIGAGVDRQALLLPVEVPDGEGTPSYFIVTSGGYRKAPVPTQDARKARVLEGDIQEALRVQGIRLEHPGSYDPSPDSREGLNNDGSIVMNSGGRAEYHRTIPISEKDIPQLAEALKMSRERVQSQPVAVVTKSATSALRQAMGPK